MELLAQLARYEAAFGVLVGGGGSGGGSITARPAPVSYDAGSDGAPKGMAQAAVGARWGSSLPVSKVKMRRDAASWVHLSNAEADVASLSKNSSKVLLSPRAGGGGRATRLPPPAGAPASPRILPPLDFCGDSCWDVSE